MSFACHSYTIRISFLCQSYVLVYHSYVILMSLVCTRMSSVCRSYVLACHPYVTRMCFYRGPCEYSTFFFVNGIFKTQKLKSSLGASFFIKSCTQIFMTRYCS